MESSPNERLLSGPRCRGEAAPALVALIALATVLPAGRLSGQPASDAPKVSASAEVSILDVDVVVTGTDGRPVHGLTAKDFEVLLGGKPVAITNFREERDPAPTAGGPAQAAPPRRPRPGRQLRNRPGGCPVASSSSSIASTSRSRTAGGSSSTGSRSSWSGRSGHGTKP